MVGAVLVRQRIDGAWADPLDVSALFTILITLGFSLNASSEMMGGLLLFFFAATYGVLLYQRRAGWLFVPTVFALLAIPALLNHLIVLVALSIAFPLAAVATRHLFTQETVRSRIQHATVQWLFNQWEWPLLVVGFVYAGIVGINDISSPTSTIQQAMSIPCPTAIELALIALSWYASARPPESRSSVANCWNTRTGSSELKTVTALVRRIFRVRSAAAASTTTGFSLLANIRQQCSGSGMGQLGTPVFLVWYDVCNSVRGGIYGAFATARYVGDGGGALPTWERALPGLASIPVVCSLQAGTSAGLSFTRDA
jgi:hypothetical protein